MENSIIYTNFMIFNDRKLAFKNKMLFDITQVPFLIPFKNNYWIVNKKKAKNKNWILINYLYLHKKTI